MDKQTEKKVQGFAIAAQPRARLDEMDKPFLMLEGYQHEFQTIKCVWLEYAPKLRNQENGQLRYHRLRCVERDMQKALASKLGAERMTQMSSTQLLVEIERGSVQKQCDNLNKIKLYEAAQETSYPIRGSCTD